VTIDISGINWLAVIVATVIYFALGAVWFAPQTPIGRAWMQAADYESPTEGASRVEPFLHRAGGDLSGHGRGYGASGASDRD
jgi:hypothetical protein